MTDYGFFASLCPGFLIYKMGVTRAVTSQHGWEGAMSSFMLSA